MNDEEKNIEVQKIFTELGMDKPREEKEEKQKLYFRRELSDKEVMIAKLKGNYFSIRLDDETTTEYIIK